jgi:hypothetical protein
MKKCEFVKPDGSPCRATPMKNSKFCYFHSPNIEESKKRESNSKGGKVGKTTHKKPLEPFALQKAEDIMGLLENTINNVRLGDMDTKIANCIGYLSSQMMKIFEIDSIEKRLDKLEEIVTDLKDKAL